MKIALWRQHNNSFFMRFKRRHHILKDDGVSLCGKFSKVVSVLDDGYGEYEVDELTEESLEYAKMQTDDYGNGMCQACLRIYERGIDEAQ